ncbi:hypothetical protein HDU99_006008, partial [Rhizoclosmatium hyalinum]
MLEYLECQYDTSTTNNRVQLREELMSMKYKPLTDMPTHLGNIQGLITHLHGMTPNASQKDEHIVLILQSLPASDNWKMLVTMLHSSNIASKKIALEIDITEVTKHAKSLIKEAADAPQSSKNHNR